LKRETSTELAVCGYNAAVAALEKHPERVRRLFFNARVGRQLGTFCRRLARERKVYRQVEDEELERIGGTVHHGGVVVLVEAPPLRAPRSNEVEAWAAAREPLLILDDVGNSHNLGALVRTAAFFGLVRVILGDGAGQALPGTAAYRIAEGGFEHVECFRVPDLGRFCREIGRIFRVVGTALEGAEPLPPGAVVGKWPEPVALVLGNEEHGLSRSVREACRHVVKIPGAGNLDSLNVSAAGAVLMFHFCRDQVS